MTVPADAWPRLKEIFTAARALPRHARPAYLAAACDGDETLRQEAERLLASDEQAAGFLETPAVLFDEIAPTQDLEGRWLGCYQIAARIGTGGMGEVYRARDTKLNRDVAIKVLLPAVADDPDRLVRFSREAQILASLNHPHIAQIHGIEDAGGQHALIMELVEGATLADRIARGALTVDEALPLAKQIAEALEAAHEHGIIHRDLKPANIKIREDGTVKVLDFGLAKTLAPASGTSGDTLSSPVPVVLPTAANVILGTTAYMSPEQARGRPVDRRADIWAFGVVVFEMLAGERPFTGETNSDTLAAVLKAEPHWRALPADTPLPIRRLLRRCLEKDRHQRLDSAAAARLEIDDALASPVTEILARAPSPSRRVTAVAITVIAGASVIALATWASWTILRPSPRTPVHTSRFTIVLSSSEPLNMFDAGRALAVSPDGQQVVYLVGGALVGGGSLMVRGVDQLDARPLAGVDFVLQPFFSPDSRWIGFFSSPGATTGWVLAKVSTNGGPAVTLCSIKGKPLGASWGDDNTIVLATDEPGTGLWQVPAGGGEPTVLTKPDATQGERGHAFPAVLPGGRAVLFTMATADQSESKVAVLDRKSGQWRTLVRGGSNAEYVDPGYLIYAAAGALRAVRFDPAKLEVLGDPVPVVDEVVMTTAGAAHYAVSRSGTLLYASGQAGTLTSLVWVDRKGREQPIRAPLRNYGIPRLSPDGTRVVVEIKDPGNIHLWIWDFARERLTRLTSGPGADGLPVWTPDGRRIIFNSDRAHPGVRNLYIQAADGTGTAERLTTTADRQYPTSISPDGMRIVGFGNPSVATSSPTPAIFRVQLFPLPGHAGAWGAGQSRGPVPSVGHASPQALFDGTFSEFSPDGRYIAYQSPESGRVEIYVRPFPQVDSGRWPISTTGGTRPAWAHNGRELFYIDESNTLTAVPVRTSGTSFSAGAPLRVLDAKYSSVFPGRPYDVSADGQRFLMLKDKATSAGLVVVLNWTEELKRHLPTTGQ